MRIQQRPQQPLNRQPNRPSPPRQGQAINRPMVDPLITQKSNNSRLNTHFSSPYLVYHQNYFDTGRHFQRPAFAHQGYQRPVLGDSSVIEANSFLDSSESTEGLNSKYRLPFRNYRVPQFVPLPGHEQMKAASTPASPGRDQKDVSSVEFNAVKKGRRPLYNRLPLRKPIMVTPFGAQGIRGYGRHPNSTLARNETKAELPPVLFVRPLGCGPEYGTIPGTCVRMKAECPGNTKTVGICAVKDHGYKCCSPVPKNVRSLPKAVAYPGFRCKTTDGQLGQCRNFNQGCGKDRIASALCGRISNRNLCCVKNASP